MAMSKTDQHVIAIMVLLILLCVAVVVYGYFTRRLPLCTAALNAFAGISIIGYWAIRQMQKQQHSFELREMIVLGLELLIATVAIYHIASGIKFKWITAMQYVFLALHVLVLLAGLVFMFTFKLNKLM